MWIKCFVKISGLTFIVVNSSTCRGLLSHVRFNMALYCVRSPHVHGYVCFWRDSHQWARASSFTRFLDHTQRRTTVGKTPLDEWSARRRDLYLTTHNIHNRQTSMSPAGFEPTTSTGERPQTYALDRAATGYVDGHKKMVKQSRNRPGVAQRVPGGLGSQISWHSAQKGGEVSLTHRPPLPPRKCSWYSFSLGAESTPGPWCDRKEYVAEKSQDRPTSSAAP